MYNISIELTQEFQKRKVEVKEFITLEENSDTVKYLFQDLELDLDYDILYPEGFSEVLEYDSQNNRLSINGYSYLVKFYQKDKDGDDYIWYSAYKDLNNLEKELISIDLGDSI
ncbi:MAG: hypothetical protein ACRCU6_03580 [Fusobacteriaceae bacterium]